MKNISTILILFGLYISGPFIAAVDASSLPVSEEKDAGSGSSGKRLINENFHELSSGKRLMNENSHELSRMKSAWDSISCDTLVHILSYLKREDVLNARRSSKALKNAAGGILPVKFSIDRLLGKSPHNEDESERNDKDYINLESLFVQLSKSGFKLIDLSKNNITFKESKIFRKAFATTQITQITLLDLQDNHISGVAIAYIADALEKMPSLTSLSLRNNRLEDDAAALLAETFRETPLRTTLIYLNLAGNRLGTKNYKELAQFASVLPEMTSLRTLDLGDNKLSDEGGTEFAPYLSRMPSLECLKLSATNLKDNDIKALAEQAFSKMVRLKDLYLDNNLFLDTGFDALTQVLPSMTSLSWLDCSHSQFQGLNIDNFIDNLLKSSSLEGLKIEGCDKLSEDVVEKLVKAMNTKDELSIFF